MRRLRHRGRGHVVEPGWQFAIILGAFRVEFSSKHKSEEIQVPLGSLDGYPLEKNLPQPRWVKIDGEGAEIHIPKGGEKLLEGDAQIVCDLHPYARAEFDITSARRQISYLDQNEKVSKAKYNAVVLERRP